MYSGSSEPFLIVYWLPKMSTWTTPRSSIALSGPRPGGAGSGVDPLAFLDQLLDAVGDFLALGDPLLLDAAQCVEFLQHVVELAPAEGLLAGAELGFELLDACGEFRVLVLEARD